MTGTMFFFNYDSIRHVDNSGRSWFSIKIYVTKIRTIQWIDVHKIIIHTV